MIDRKTESIRKRENKRNKSVRDKERKKGQKGERKQVRTLKQFLCHAAPKQVLIKFEKENKIKLDDIY